MKKIFITLALILVSCTTFAQVYNFEYSNNKTDGYHICFTHDDNCIYFTSDFSIQGYGFSLRAVDAKTSLDLIFQLTELNKIFEDTYNIWGVVPDESKVLAGDRPIQIELSNGDILRSNTQNGIMGIAYVFISSGSITVNNKKQNDNGYYVMSLLRTYDIVNIVVDGASIKAPVIHTADTFDAMCKTLIAKAGDKGQYGKRLIGGNNVTTKTQGTQTKPSTSNSQKNSNNTSTNKTPTTIPNNNIFNESTIPSINILNYIKYPFGIKELNARHNTKNAFNSAMNKYHPKIKRHKYDGFDGYYYGDYKNPLYLTYRGKKMTVAGASFDKLNHKNVLCLRQFWYSFDFDKSTYTSKDIYKFVNAIIQDLYDEGIFLYNKEGALTKKITQFEELKLLLDDYNISLKVKEDEVWIGVTYNPF